MPAQRRALDVVSILSMATFLVWADRQVVAPVLPAIARDFHASIGAAAEVVSVYSLVYGLCEIGYGSLSDRFGRVRVMSAALQVFGVGTLLTGLMPSLGTVVALRGLTGAAAAAIVPLSLTYIGDTVALRDRQSAIGRVNTANALGQALSVALGGLMAQIVSWRVLFIVYGAASSLVALRLRRAPESHGGTASGQRLWRTFAELLRRPGVWLLYCLAALEGGTLMGTYVYLSPALKLQGYSYLLIGFVLAAFGVTCLPATRLMRPLLRTRSPLLLIWVSGVCVVLGWLLVALRTEVWTVLVCAALLGLAYAWLHSALQTWATTAHPAARGTGVSGYAFSLFVGAGVFTQLFAPLADRGAYQTMFVLTAGLGVLLTVAAAYGYQRYVGRPAAVVTSAAE